MQHFRQAARADALADAAAPSVGGRLPVILVSTAGVRCQAAAALRSLGAELSVIPSLYDALVLVVDDMAAASLLVIECLDHGELQAGRRVWADLRRGGRAKPVVLIVDDCPSQSFPARNEGPIVLRGPVSVLALRLAFEACFPACRTALREGGDMQKAPPMGRAFQKF